MRTLKLNLALAPVVAALSLGVSVADAGTFQVAACDTSVASGANNSWVPYTDAGMAAYADCRPAGEGLVARNVQDGGTAPAGARGALIFDAPPGTGVVALRFDGALERGDCGYSTIIVVGGQDFGGRAAWGYGANSVCPGPYAAGPTAFNVPGEYFNAMGNRYRLETQCVSATCNRSSRNAVRIKNVRVTLIDEVDPSLTNPRGGLWSGTSWVGGVQGAGLTGADNAGVREQRVAIDGRVVASQSLPCDATQRIPCPPTASLDRELNTAAFGGDGRHQLRLSVVDTAGNEKAVTRDVLIDNTAPDAPEVLRVAGGDGWRSRNGFDVSWDNPVQQHAPIAAAEYEICRTSGGDCVTQRVDGADIDHVDGLKVPGAGEWQLKLWLRDAAGNADRRLIAPPMRLRFDDTSPEPRIARLSPDDPTKLVVATQDSGSGLASGSVELRRTGSATWRAQRVAVEGDRLIASIDDERLLDGIYDVRATAVDQAGNARTAQVFDDGAAAQLRMPIRLKTSIRGGIRRGTGKHAKLVKTAVVSYGQRVRVRGRLVTPEGNPVEDATVEVTSETKGLTQPPALLASVKTSKSGAFTLLARRGPSRRIVMRYSGAPRIRSATRVLQLNVRARTTIRPNRRRLVNGESVRLSGRILSKPIPAAGKLVEVQVFVRGRWRTFATTRSGRRGTWRYDYRFDGTRGLQKYRFRARIPRESEYPFATGRSKATSVVVRGT